MAAEAAGAKTRTYYDVLGLPNRAGTLLDIKAAYRRVLLAAHPDKVSGTTGAEVDLIREAWRILSDEATRKEYDAKLKSNNPPSFGGGHANLVSVDGMIIKDAFVSVDLDDMSYNPETLTYSFPCRCGKKFAMTEDDLERGRDLVECKGCSSWIRISYEIFAE
jgi:diphthamide biosynthesis protein 4